MLTIGFADKFYTLWNCNNEVQYAKDYNGNGYATGTDIICIYIQNLSTDFESAKAKYPVANIDLNLRGTGTFRVRGEHKYIVAPEDHSVFSFGKLNGCSIAETNEVYQLQRGLSEEKGGRRKVNCRKRLIELGELVPYKWENTIGKWDEVYQDIMPIIVKKSYATPKEVEKMEAEKLEKSLSGHFFVDGSKVKLSIKLFKIFGFDSAYGYTTVAKYITSCGKMVSYMGSNPLDISSEEFEEVTATIKHDNYKGNNTKLIRIKKSICNT